MRRAAFLTATVMASLAASSVGVVTRPPTACAADERESRILREVKAPDGFELSLFAAPPQVNYPVFVAAAADGTLFVSSDKNGSIDRKPQRGSVVRLRDRDGDGRADEVKTFVPDVDSPRGLVWDGDRLYLMHPPHLSAFIDKDGDGVADEQKILVKNIAFGFKDRPADHTSNGVTLGVDGWLYLAIGDFGFMEAEGTDGRKLRLRAGGVVRVRPDGTGLELLARGTRNIVEVALTPTLDAFARDNTNDGDGWDIRLHHFVPFGEHGYPSLYKNFADEILAPLADYGGGSGCGALYLDEPGFPAGFGDALYTADWGRERVYRHRLTPRGATFTLDQDEFLRIPRATDLDADARGNIYVASWKGGMFTYGGEDVGYVVRVRPAGAAAPALPDFATADAGILVSALGGPSHRARLEAQRTLLRRGLVPAAAAALVRLARDGTQPVPGRVAALFALSQGSKGKDAMAALSTLARDRVMRPFALRALSEAGAGAGPGGRLQAFDAAVGDGDARVRREAAAGLARSGRREQGRTLARLLGDADGVVAHSAVRGLVALGAGAAAFAVLDRRDAPAAARTGALRALAGMHDPRVVEGLLRRLSKEQDRDRRREWLVALARLYHREGPWKGDGWGTRPDTSGPYYQREKWAESPRIAAALKARLAEKDADEAAFLVRELGRHHVQLDDTLDRVVALARARPDLIPAAATQLAEADEVPAGAVSFLVAVATAAGSDAPVRADAIVALARTRDPTALSAMLDGLVALGGAKAERDVNRARQAFLRSPLLEIHHGRLEGEVARPDSPRAGWAASGLIALKSNPHAAPEVRLLSEQTLETAWTLPSGRAVVLQAAALGRHRSYADKIRAAQNDSNPAVAQAAREAARALNLDPKPGQKPGAPTGKPAPAEILVGALSNDQAMAAVLKRRGEAGRGEQVFQRAGCALCHTTSPDQPLRGPFLGNIATIYKRGELAEAILLPSKSLAQGFVTHLFELKDGSSQEGFVVKEAAEGVVIRNVGGEEVQVRAKDIARRSKLERSIMPEGLASALTVTELASLLDYLEGLAKK